MSAWKNEDIKMVTSKKLNSGDDDINTKLKVESSMPLTIPPHSKFKKQIEHCIYKWVVLLAKVF